MSTPTVVTAALPMDRIHANPNQPRKYFDPQAIQDLKDSLEKRGLINPISVVKSGDSDYTIIAGERRFQAAKDLKWEQIDCRIWPTETTPREVELLSLVENIQREELTPLEVANGYKLLTQDPYNLTQETIAAQLGKSQQAVGHYMTISQLEPEVQDITNRLVNLGIAHLMQIYRLKSTSEQISMAQKASQQGWSVKQLTAEVSKKLPKNGTRSRSKPIIQEPVDPLAPAWAKLQSNQDLAPGVHWEVKFGSHKLADGTKLNGWFFFAMPVDGSAPEVSLATWLCQLGQGLGGGAIHAVLPEMVQITKKAEQSLMDTLKPRLPQSPEEEKELNDLAVRGGPRAIYEWIYGKGSPMAEAAPQSWEEAGISDPLTSLKQILGGIKAFAGIQ